MQYLNSSSVSLNLRSRPRRTGSLRRSASSKLPRRRIGLNLSCCVLRSRVKLKIFKSCVGEHGLCPWNRLARLEAMDDDLVDVSSLIIWGDSDGDAYRFSSSEGEDSDGEFILQPIADIDLPTTSEQFNNDDDSITTTRRLAMLHRAHKRRKTKYGILNNFGLITFLTLLLLLVDCCAWRIVRLPLEPLYLMRPFFISAVTVSCIGYTFVPLLRTLKLQSIIKDEGYAVQSSKRRTPTMGGLYFIPVGIIVAEVLVGFSSTEVFGASVATLAFAVIGLLDDFTRLRNNDKGLPGSIIILLEVTVGTLFSFWLYATDISSPYRMKMVIPLPAPIGLVCLGKFYPVLTSFCFASMANGINLTNGFDGLAGGTAALAFIGMSIAVLPICSDLAVFGASMSGSCVGFLLHNRYKASIFMGATGALALGGALSAMAASTGMFFPLLVSSGIVFLEALSAITQISFFKVKKHLGTGRGVLRAAPFHHRLELLGLKEPFIVAGAYLVSSFLAVCAGYVGLISV